MALYSVQRLLFGHVEARRPSTFQLIALFVAYSAGQGAFSAALTALFPGAP
jgi:cytochrome c oxidase subunit I+III